LVLDAIAGIQHLESLRDTGGRGDAGVGDAGKHRFFDSLLSQQQHGIGCQEDLASHSRQIRLHKSLNGSDIKHPSTVVQFLPFTLDIDRFKRHDCRISKQISRYICQTVFSSKTTINRRTGICGVLFSPCCGRGAGQLCPGPAQGNSLDAPQRCLREPGEAENPSRHVPELRN